MQSLSEKLPLQSLITSPPLSRAPKTDVLEGGWLIKIKECSCVGEPLHQTIMPFKLTTCGNATQKWSRLWAALQGHVMVLHQTWLACPEHNNIEK